MAAGTDTIFTYTVWPKYLYVHTRYTRYSVLLSYPVNTHFFPVLGIFSIKHQQFKEGATSVFAGMPSS